MCDDDRERADVDVRVWRRARKEHRCDACREPIRRGDRYHLTSSLYDGIWTKWVHCARCMTICEALWKANGGAFIAYGLDCGETWEENFGKLPEEIARLAFVTADEMQAELRRSGDAGG